VGSNWSRGWVTGRAGAAAPTLRWWRRRAPTHLWKPSPHEVAAGSVDVSRHELDYLAQAYWHGFRFRFGEMIALDRTRRLVHLCGNTDEDGRLITPGALDRLRQSGDRDRQHLQ
jgi:NADH dehydrogenase